MAIMALDALDKSILAALADDGRQSQVDLAERVPLSPTAIARRIRALEEAGVIEGYHAKISRRALGLEMTVIVQISLKSQGQDLLDAFRRLLSSDVGRGRLHADCLGARPQRL
jgi:Lrp/AsnC family leucine-responsive transcriptional regulator